MDQNDHSSAECLPVSFFRPEGVSLDYGRLNEERLARKIKVPVQTDIESPVPSLEVYPVSDAKHVQNLIKAYSDQELSEETKERHIDLLEHIQRDLRSHAVVRADADGALQGFVIIRRAVEYVSSKDGNPSTVRMIHDILDSFEIADGVLDAITAACNVMVLSDVYHLHRSASEIAGEIRGSPFDDDEFGPDISSEEVLSVRVECHL